MFLKLSIGDKAPDFNFETPWNKSNSFYKTSTKNTIVLIFLRYIGCPVCQMLMTEIKRNINLIKGKKVIVFIVLQSSPDTVAAISNKEDWPFTIICDPQAKIFKSYHVEAGGIIQYLHPVGLAAALKATIKGCKHGKFEGKETQLPASFVITADKLIKYVHYGKRINDVPSLEKLSGHID